jgi:processive 1,2-diacylglycerol beta-glucosyltransferase
VTSARRADRKRVLVFSASFGGPHRAVADAVVRYMKGSHSADVNVQDVDFLERFMPSVNVLAKFGYRQSAQFFPMLTGDLAQATVRQPDNSLVHELASGAQGRIRSFLSEYRPDAVVSVLPVAAAAASEVAADVGFFSAAVHPDYSTHGMWIHPGTHAYFVATREVRDELVVEGVEWGQITVSGLPVLSGRAKSRDRRQRRKDMGLADRFTCVAVASPGSGAEIPELASRVASCGIQVAVSLDAAPRLSRSIAALSKRSDLVRPFGKDTSVESLLGVADIVVSRAGGATPVSAMSLGVPLILYNPVPGQELYNVDFLVNSGAALHARDQEDVAEKLRFLSTHPERLRQMAVDSASLGRADAAETVCERVLACVG